MPLPLANWIIHNNFMQYNYTYKQCNLPMSPSVGRWDCHNFLSEHLFIVTMDFYAQIGINRLLCSSVIVKVCIFDLTVSLQSTYPRNKSPWLLSEWASRSVRERVTRRDARSRCTDDHKLGRSLWNDVNILNIQKFTKSIQEVYVYVDFLSPSYT